ncbi:unnamed protein product, partial [Prorocentrum cordatum]
KVAEPRRAGRRLAYGRAGLRARPSRRDARAGGSTPEARGPQAHRAQEAPGWLSCAFRILAPHHDPPPMELSPLLLGLQSAPPQSPCRRRNSAPVIGAGTEFEAIDVVGSSIDDVLYADAEAVRLKTPQVTPREAAEFVQRQESSVLREGLQGDKSPAVVVQPAYLVTESLLFPGLAKDTPLSPRKHRSTNGNGSQMTGMYSLGTPTTACPSDEYVLISNSTLWDNKRGSP